MSIPETTPASNASNTGVKIVLHHLENSRSQRIIWLLEELEVPYDVVKYNRVDLQAPEEMKSIHPLGKSPILTDGDVSLAESGAIIEYLITKYGGDKFKPTEAGWIDNLYFSHYAEGSLMPIIVNKLIFSLLPQQAPFFIRPVASLITSTVTKSFLIPRLKENSDFIEAHLEKVQTGWFANGDNPTSADFQMSFALESLISSLPVGPKIKEYVGRVHERPAYKRALEKGGNFSIIQ